MNEQQDREQAQREAQDLTRVIAIGMDVRSFMASAAGLYLHAKANQEVIQAQEQLVDVDATDIDRIQALQLQARVAQRVLSWIGEIVSQGEAAESQFAEMQSFPD